MLTLSDYNSVISLLNLLLQVQQVCCHVSQICVLTFDTLEVFKKKCLKVFKNLQCNWKVEATAGGGVQWR